MVNTGPREDYSRAVIHGAAWRYLAFISGKLMVLISTAVLARLLTKDDFGVVGFALTTMAFLDVLSDMGVGPALIYHEENQENSSTAYWINVGMRFMLFGVAWILAPLVGSYFQDERAVGVIRVMSLSYPISALGTVHAALLSKKLAFGKTFIPSLVHSVAKGVASIVFALTGFGAWSLVYGQLIGELLTGIVYWLVSPWRPRFIFALSKARSLLDYGIRYVGADLIAMLLLNLDYLLVGRYLGAEALGVYTVAFRLPDLVILQFARTLSFIVFPVYSRMREVTSSLANGFYNTTRYIMLITVPLGLGLALVARPFIEVIFSEKWLDAVPALQGIAIYSMLLSFAYNAGGVYKATGRPQIIMWLGIVRLAMLFPALWWAVSSAKSITAVSWMHALVAFISACISLLVAARIIDLPLKRLAHAAYPSLLGGAFMAVAVFFTLVISEDFAPVIQLILGVSVGASVYGLVLWISQREMVFEIRSRLRNAVRRGET